MLSKFQNFYFVLGLDIYIGFCDMPTLIIKHSSALFKKKIYKNILNHDCQIFVFLILVKSSVGSDTFERLDIKEGNTAIRNLIDIINKTKNQKILIQSEIF